MRIGASIKIFRYLFVSLCHVLFAGIDCKSSSNSTPLDIFCNFENNLCGWNSTGKSVEWKRQKGSLQTIVDGPGIDHTFVTGYYIYIQAPINISEESYAILESPVFFPVDNDSYCFSFAYHMFGIKVESLEVILEKTPKTEKFSETIWSRRSSQGNQWNKANVTVRSNEPYKIVIRAYVRYSQFIWSIALDDTFLRKGKCLTPDNMCDFEMGLCNLISVPTNSWQLGTPTQLSHFPHDDHTTGSTSGHFIYAEPSASSSSLDSQALLITHEQQPTKSSCLEIWYVILDDETSLDIQINYLSIQPTSIVSLRRVYSTEAKTWSPVKIPIVSNTTYKIIFKATFGYKEVLIDDIIIHRRSCEVPDFCTFQYGFCEWMNNVDSHVRWLRSSGGVQVNKFPAPETDATYTGTGYFALFPVKNLPVNYRAVLMSESFSYGPFLCITLQYSLSEIKSDVGTLRVIIHIGSRSYRKQLLEITEKTGSSTWVETSVAIACTKEVPILKFQISVEAIAGEGEGYIAIDNLQITNKTCPGVPDILQAPESVIPECFIIAPLLHNETVLSNLTTPLSDITTLTLSSSTYIENSSTSTFDIRTTSSDNIILKTTVSSCQNVTECENLKHKGNVFLTAKETLMYVTIPVAGVLVTVIVILSIAFYRYRKRTAWLEYIGMVKGPHRRKMLMPYDQNSMKDNPIDVTDSAAQAAQHRGLFAPNGNCVFNNGSCIIIENYTELGSETSVASESNA